MANADRMTVDADPSADDYRDVIRFVRENASELGISEPTVITHPSPTKTLEHYADFYIVEQRGWRVKIANTGAVESDQLARLLVSESDIQLLLHLAEGCGSSKDAEVSEIDIRKIRRAEPLHYSIAPAAGCLR